MEAPSGDDADTGISERHRHVVGRDREIRCQRHRDAGPCDGPVQTRDHRRRHGRQGQDGTMERIDDGAHDLGRIRPGRVKARHVATGQEGAPLPDSTTARTVSSRLT